MSERPGMALIPNKRAFLARGLRRLGLLAALERFAKRPGLLVLTYHRIGDVSADPYYAPVWSATADGLAEELRAFRQARRVIGLEELIALAERGFRTREALGFITFDDGYRDNHDLALPILRSLNLPATFFLATAFLDAPRLPWWDHVAYVIRTTRQPSIRLDRPEPMDVALEGTREAAINRIVRAYLDHRVVDDPGFRAHLEERAEVSVDERALGEALFVTWPMARALNAGATTVGSHALTHRALGHLTEPEQAEELSGSRRILQERLGTPIHALAYPYGWPGTFDGSTERLAREAGYRVAFSSTEGVNLPESANPFAVRRLGVGLADPPVLHRTRWALHVALGRSAL